jgi:HlyD family secretion protein
VVEQTFYNIGEWVPANAPVVAVLPDERRKLRFYVPQDRIAGVRTGSSISFACDGCGGRRQAKISYVSPRAEFTPPVIYSEHARAKLVFLVEAILPVSDRPLPPGLPVEVAPQ